MTGEQLRDELTRIAEAAPEVHVDSDVFDRGRRAYRRTQALVAGAVVACLALVAGIGWQVTRDDPAPVAEGEARTGVPDHIYGPPGDGSPLDVPLSSLQRVGRAAAAYLADDHLGNVVMVTADGDYHVLRLPDLYEPMLNDVSPVLSPDGRRVAWSTHAGKSRGLAIAELATGDVREVELLPGLGAHVSSLQWSLDSRWLIWSGQAVTQLTESGGRYGRPTAGVVGPDGQAGSLPPVKGNGWDGAGVCADGTAVRYEHPAFFSSAGGTEVRHRRWRDLATDHAGCSVPTSVLDVPREDYVGPGEGADQTRVVGWLPGAGTGLPVPVVLVANWVDEGGGSAWLDGLLLRVGREDVGRVDVGGAKNHTIATGLMARDRPTVPAGRSPWPEPSWWTEHRTELIAASLPFGALAILGFWLRRRMRSGS